MSKKEVMKKAPVAPVWKASEMYTLAQAQKAGENARTIAIGYLLTLSKADPTCSRRDSRRQGLPLATAIHGHIWTACCNRSMALPTDTAKADWEKAVKEIYEIALAAYADKAAKAKADRDKKAEESKAEGPAETPAETPADTPDTYNPHEVIIDSVAAIIVAISALPVEERPMAARKACSEIMSRFE